VRNKNQRGWCIGERGVMREKRSSSWVLRGWKVPSYLEKGRT
jgi:hypothetical protein